MGYHFSVPRQQAELKLAESYTKDHGGLLPDDLFWRYVEQRFSQTLATGHFRRFKHYHPRITPLLLHNLEVMHHPALGGMMPPSLPVMSPITTPGVPIASTPMPMVPISTPNPGTPIVSTPMGPTLTPVSVSEPASYLLLAGGLLFVLLWWFLERKRS